MFIFFYLHVKYIGELSIKATVIVHKSCVIRHKNKCAFVQIVVENLLTCVSKLHTKKQILMHKFFEKESFVLSEAIFVLILKKIPGSNKKNKINFKQVPLHSEVDSIDYIILTCNE